MRTVGQILKETREAKLLTLEDVERQTRIRVELLTALEKDDYDKLPPATFIQGFIKNYGRFLQLDIDKLLALFRRDYEAKKHMPVVMESLKNPNKKKKFMLTPSMLIGTVVVLIVLCFFAYLWVEYRQFVGAPELTVVSPQDQQTVDIPSVVVEGKTEPEVKVAVNEQEVGTDSEGKFREEIKLSATTNKVTITATSKFGQQAKVERTVFVKK
jgi:cytoskeletal protein RodZ